MCYYYPREMSLKTLMSLMPLLPLMWSTSIPLGGLGLDPLRIGTALGVFGLINAFVQVRIMGPVLRRFGARRVFRVSFSSLLFSLVFFPIMKYFAQRAGRVDGIVVALMVAQLTSQMLLYFAYGMIKSYKLHFQLLTKHSSTLTRYHTCSGRGEYTGRRAHRHDERPSANGRLWRTVYCPDIRIFSVLCHAPAQSR